MTYLVTDNCIRCRFTDCVDVCPVDAFHAGPNFLAINPDECIDCHVCVSECPASAIYPDTSKDIDVPLWTDINTRLSKKWPVITKKIQALPDAGQWNGVKDKLKYLEE